MKEPDHTLRTFDQVIHELGHSLHWRYGIADTSEEWPQAIQRWFAAPIGTADAAKETLVKSLFKSQASFSCETY